MDNYGIVVCTKDRPDRVSTLLSMLASQSDSVQAVVLVDSSQSVYSGPTYGLPIHIQASLPGLPRQRQMGLEISRRLGASTIIFLDDDVEIQSGLLESLGEAMRLYPNSLIGTNDMSTVERVQQKYLFRGKSNFISKGCLPVLGKTPTYPSRVDWVPGFLMAGPTAAFLDVGFNTSIRMIGEDVEFQLRWSASGRDVVLAPDIGLSHRADTRGRADFSTSLFFWDSIRYKLVLDWPTKFSKRVFFAELILLLLWSLFFNWPAARGHTRFLLDRIRKKALRLDLATLE